MTLTSVIIRNLILNTMVKLLNTDLLVYMQIVTLT